MKNKISKRILTLIFSTLFLCSCGYFSGDQYANAKSEEECLHCDPSGIWTEGWCDTYDEGWIDNKYGCNNYGYEWISGYCNPPYEEEWKLNTRSDAEGDDAGNIEYYEEKSYEEDEW